MKHSQNWGLLRRAILLGSLVGCSLALSFVAVAPVLAQCNCTVNGECAFSTCCYSPGFCVPDGVGTGGHKCNSTAKLGGGGYTSCTAGESCQTDDGCDLE